MLRLKKFATEEKHRESSTRSTRFQTGRRTTINSCQQFLLCPTRSLSHHECKEATERKTFDASWNVPQHSSPMIESFSFLTTHLLTTLLDTPAPKPWAPRKFYDSILWFHFMIPLPFGVNGNEKVNCGSSQWYNIFGQVYHILNWPKILLNLKWKRCINIACILFSSWQ